MDLFSNELILGLMLYNILLQMLHGQVMSRDDFLASCDKNEAPKRLVDIFKKDQRGNDTVQMIIICNNFFRLIWFQFPEVELERARSKKSSVSALVMIAFYGSR